MKRSVLCLLLVFSIQQAGSAQESVEHTGKLNGEIKVERAVAAFRCKPVSAEEKAKLPAPLAEGDEAFSGKINWQHKRDVATWVVLVEPKKGQPFIYVDIDQNGDISKSERFTFPSVKESSSASGNVMNRGGEMVLKFPVAQSPFKYYPVKLQLFNPTPDSKTKDSRMILQSLEAYVEGTVEIKGRKTLVRYNVDPQTGKADSRNGYLGMDGDGDGKIDMSFVSPEAAYAKDEDVIFRVGDRYVSTKTVDTSSLKVTLKEHPASEYQRIELRIGAEIPDFAFTDFDGKQRNLSEFRGKYLLLDFWGTWCGPCVGEIPFLKEAYEKYKSRGFEILGMDQDKEIDKVKAFLAEKKATWTQATTPSIEVLLDKRFRITAFPTTVLLDPQGKIISLGRKDQYPLRDKALLDSLEKLMPAAKPEGTR